MTYLNLKKATAATAFMLAFWSGPALACDGTGRDGCSCIAYSGDYHRMGDEVIADYEMSVDAQDLRNSKGAPLKTIRAVLQQDRANYHVFNKSSNFDKYDGYFTTLSRRTMFQSLPLTSFCGTDSADPSIMYDRVNAVAKAAMRRGALVHVMLYRIRNDLRLHIAIIG